MPLATKFAWAYGVVVLVNEISVICTLLENLCMNEKLARLAKIRGIIIIIH